MASPSSRVPPDLVAAQCAMRGESDFGAVRDAITSCHLRPVIAVSRRVHAGVRTLAAVLGGFSSLVFDADLTNPDVSDIFRRLIGACPVPWQWAEIAPAGWGASVAGELYDAVRNETCSPAIAAALIGPCDETAALLSRPSDIVSVIRRWGLSDPGAPTAWTLRISPQAYNRIIRILTAGSPGDDSAIVDCLPWLPRDDDVMTAVQACMSGAPFRAGWRARAMRDDPDILRGSAAVRCLHAFADATNASYAAYADFVQGLLAWAKPFDLRDVVRLACTTEDPSFWSWIQRALHDVPDEALDIVATVSWERIPEPVQNVILSNASGFRRCAAIAMARGKQAPSHRILSSSRLATLAFFAALDPDVWNDLTEERRRALLQTLDATIAPLAIRSLGVHPQILARASLTNNLVAAARQYIHDPDALRDILHPVALHDVPIPSVYHLIADSDGIPHDPAFWFCVASGHGDPDAIRPESAALVQNPRRLAAAVVAQRVALEQVQSSKPGRDNVAAYHCDLLTQVFGGWTWDDLAPIRDVLSADARTAIFPDAVDTVVERLAQPNRRDALEAALARLRSLAPDIALPAYRAIRALAYDLHHVRAAEKLATLLRHHGDVFVQIADAITEPAQNTLLPPPPEPLTDALRDAARVDPVHARHLSAAIAEGRHDVVASWVQASPHRAAAIVRRIACSDAPISSRSVDLATVLQAWTWHDLNAALMTLSDDARADVLPDRAALVSLLAHPERQEDMRRALDDMMGLPPAVAVPALHAIQALGRDAMRADAARTLANLLRRRGDIFLQIAESLSDPARAAILPLLSPSLAGNLRELAHVDPEFALRLASALATSERDSRTLTALLAEAPHSVVVALLTQMLTRMPHRADDDRADSDAGRQDDRHARRVR